MFLYTDLKCYSKEFTLKDRELLGHEEHKALSLYIGKKFPQKCAFSHLWWHMLPCCCLSASVASLSLLLQHVSNEMKTEIWERI